MAFDLTIEAVSINEWAFFAQPETGLAFEELFGQSADITGLIEDFLEIDFAAISETVVTLPSAIAAGLQTGFDFSVSVSSAAPVSADLLATVTNITSAALANWGQYVIGAPGANLQVAVTLTQQGPNVLASAGGTTINPIQFDGTNVLAQLNTLTELRTGIDPNGATADIVVTINTDFLLGPSAFLSTDPNRQPPPGSIDYLSVLTHEIGHGLGFLDLRDANFFPQAFFSAGGVPLPTFSNFDALIAFDPIPPGVFSIPLPDGTTLDPATVRLGQPFFVGQTATTLYGDRVPLEFLANSTGTDVAHFLDQTVAANAAGLFQDLGASLMAGFINNGEVIDIGALELALFRDIGAIPITFGPFAGAPALQVIIPDDLPLINTNDFLFPEPSVFSVSGFQIEGDAIVFNVISSSGSLFTTRAAVGVAIAGDGGVLVDRVFEPVQFPEGLPVVAELGIAAETLVSGAADAESATGIGNGLLVTLFSPSNAVLASGARQETTRFEASISFSTLSARGLDATGEILTRDEISGLAGSNQVQDRNFYALLGDGDANLEVIETAFLLGDTGYGARLSNVAANADDADPVSIRGHGRINNNTVGDLTEAIRFSNERGFGLDNGPDGEGRARILNNGDSITFQLAEGFAIETVAFRALADTGVTGPLRLAFDTDGDVVTPGLLGARGSAPRDDAAVEIEVEAGARVELDFRNDRILVDGVALEGDFSALFSSGDGAAVTIGSLSGKGFSIAEAVIARVAEDSTGADLVVEAAASAGAGVYFDAGLSLSGNFDQRALFMAEAM